MSDARQSEYRYWAFISYSSKDAAWARWLHRAVETYGIPAHLVGHPSPTGESVPKRFQPVFRDRDELPASADLGAQIEQALRASRNLIVICSRRAAQSKWVSKEISTFRDLGRREHVFAFIVDGEPNAGDESECFPPALRELEPIAADARPTADGRTNAKLKLLAGMLGVSFDALKQRDAQRQVRRLQQILGAALVVAAGFAALAWYATQQRDKAVSARHQAEEVLEFLLYDMRDELEKVGRLDLADKVRERVEEYYRTLGVEPDVPRTQKNRAAALGNRGHLAFAKGDLVEALQSYKASLEIAERLAAQDPGNAQWQRDLAASHGMIGDLRVAQGELPQALESYEASLTIKQRLVAKDPGNTASQHNLAVSHAKIGHVHMRQGDLPKALGAYQAGLGILIFLGVWNPGNAGWQHDLAASYNQIGDVRALQRGHAEALESYEASLAIMGRIAAKDPGNAVWQRDLSVSHNKIGDVPRKPCRRRWRRTKQALRWS